MGLVSKKTHKKLEPQSGPWLKLKQLLTDPSKTFLILASVFGLLMVFIMPPLMVPDEAVHFYRAYQVGEGDIFSENRDGEVGGMVPQIPSVSEGTPGLFPRVPTTQLLSQRIDESFVAFPTSALYTPVSYVPQAVGINIGRVIYGSIGLMLTMGRIVNLACYIVLIYFAVRLAKKGKWVYVTIGLFPVAIQEAASISTDALNIGLCLLFIALLQNLFYQREKITTHQIWMLILLALSLGLTKQTNLILLLPLLFLPRHLFGSLGRKLKIAVPITFAGFLIAGAWYIAAAHVYNDLNGAAAVGLQGVDPASQLRFLLTNPFDFIITLIQTFVIEGFKQIAISDFLWFSMHSILSWLTYKLPLTFVILGYVLLVVTLLYDEDKQHEKHLFPGLIFTATFFISLLGIGTALYLVWTSVGATQIAGLQGRYFLPMIPLLIPGFLYISRYFGFMVAKRHYMGVLVTLVSSLNLVVALGLTYLWFY